MADAIYRVRAVDADVAHRRRTKNENEIARSSLAGRKLRLCRNALLLRSRRGPGLWIWPGLWILCRAPSAASSSGRVRAGAWSWLCVGRRLLVSSGPTLELARRVLGSAALRGRVLDRSALLRRPLLCGLLAQISSVINFFAGAAPVAALFYAIEGLGPACWSGSTGRKRQIHSFIAFASQGEHNSAAPVLASASPRRFRRRARRRGP